MGTFKHSIIRVSTPTLTAECIDTGFDFEGCHGSVFLRNELYCYFIDGTFSKIYNIDSSPLRTYLATIMNEKLLNFALTGYTLTTESHIFLTGGSGKNASFPIVAVYHVDRDYWSLGPRLNFNRERHSSCILGDKLYVSGSAMYELDTIEVANCSELINYDKEYYIDGSHPW